MARSIPKAEKKKQQRSKTYAQLKRELDRVFSIWVRKRDADENGIGTCISCSAKMPWPKLQAGHFVRRNVLSLRWHERNVNSQCYRCNVAMRGNYPAYAAALGGYEVAWLHSASKFTYKLTRADLQALIVRYSDPLPEASISDSEQSSG